MPIKDDIYDPNEFEKALMKNYPNESNTAIDMAITEGHSQIASLLKP